MHTCAHHMTPIGLAKRLRTSIYSYQVTPLHPHFLLMIKSLHHDKVLWFQVECMKTPSFSYTNETEIPIKCNFRPCMKNLSLKPCCLKRVSHYDQWSIILFVIYSNLPLWGDKVTFNSSLKLPRLLPSFSNSTLTLYSPSSDRLKLRNIIFMSYLQRAISVPLQGCCCITINLDSFGQSWFEESPMLEQK